MAEIQEDDAPAIPEWVVTFGDMMSLLLTFFIMLVSMSEIKNEEKYQAMVDSFRRQFGHATAIESFVPGPLKPRNSDKAMNESSGHGEKDTKKGGQPDLAPRGDNDRVDSIDPPDHLTKGCILFFDEGSAELTEAAKRKLHVAIPEIAGKPQLIEIRGHTVTRPPPADSPYKNNWELAFARCEAVKNYILDTYDIDSRRLRLNVAAGNEPKFSHELFVKQNARVEIYMLDQIPAAPVDITPEERQVFETRGPSAGTPVGTGQ